MDPCAFGPPDSFLQEAYNLRSEEVKRQKMAEWAKDSQTTQEPGKSVDVMSTVDDVSKTIMERLQAGTLTKVRIPELREEFNLSERAALLVRARVQRLAAMERADAPIKYLIINNEKKRKIQADSSVVSHSDEKANSEQEAA